MNDIDVEAIRKRVQKRLRQRQEFYIHAAIFVPVNLMLWLIGILTGSIAEFPWPLIVTIGWGIGLISHGVDVYFKTSERVSRHEENEVQREIERERMLRYGSADLEKPKRGAARLSDDGEIEYDDESAAPSVRKSRGRE